MKRRQFIGTTLGSAAVVALPRVGRPSTGHEIVLKNVQALIGGEFKKCDIGISEGRIAAIDQPGTLISGNQVIEGGDLYVSPGWVDYHVHLVDREYGRAVGVPVSRLGVEHGVTALVDAGTTGAADFRQFKEAVNDSPKMTSFAFINIKRQGIKLTEFYRTRKGWDDIPAMEVALSEYGNLIVGIKVRVDKMLTPRSDRLYYVRKCREAGDLFRLPVMVHIGPPPPSLTEILPLLKQGDTITHCLRGQGNCVVDERGKIRDDVKDAYERGVRFDVGHGTTSFSFSAAEHALEQGFTDLTISSDIHLLSARRYAKTFANVMTQFLAIGMPLEDIAERASTRPARLLGIERKIEPGAEAALTVFRVVEGDFTCVDVVKDTRKSAGRIIPEWTILNGKAHRAGDLDRELFL